MATKKKYAAPAGVELTEQEARAWKLLKERQTWDERDIYNTYLDPSPAGGSQLDHDALALFTAGLMRALVAKRLATLDDSDGTFRPAKMSRAAKLHRSGRSNDWCHRAALVASPWPAVSGTRGDREPPPVHGARQGTWCGSVPGRLRVGPGRHRDQMAAGSYRPHGRATS
jgi:hypothetical protein